MLRVALLTQAASVRLQHGGHRTRGILGTHNRSMPLAEPLQVARLSHRIAHRRRHGVKTGSEGFQHGLLRLAYLAFVSAPLQTLLFTVTDKIPSVSR